MKKALFSSAYAGFTLIELLMVISILALLSSIVLVSTGNSRERAKIARAKEEVRVLYQALLRYHTDTGTYPSCGVGSSNFEDISTDPEIGWNSSWKNGYIGQPIPNDPWGTSYYYDGCPLPGHECTAGGSSVCSAGPDRGYESFNETDMIANDDDICIYFRPEC